MLLKGNNPVQSFVSHQIGTNTFFNKSLLKNLQPYKILPPIQFSKHNFSVMKSANNNSSFEHSHFYYSTKIKSPDQFQEIFRYQPTLCNHPKHMHLLNFISPKSYNPDNTYPKTTKQLYQQLKQNVPLTFQEGNTALDWIKEVKKFVQQQDIDITLTPSVMGSLKLLETLIYTECVTKPIDLWTIQQVLSALKDSVLIHDLLDFKTNFLDSYAKKHGYNISAIKKCDQLSIFNWYNGY